MVIYMKVNIVTVHGGWILYKNAERMVEANKELSTGVDMSLSFVPRDDVDINYYVSMDNCFWRKSKVIDVGYFTHLDKDWDYFHPHWWKIDFIVHQCRKYYDRFIELGYPKEKMTVLRPGLKIDMFPLKKIKLGIFQRGGFEGKGENFLMKLSENAEFLKNFHFVFVGGGWENVLFEFNKKGISFECHDSEKYEDYPKLYEKIDYLLIPGKWEGGPMCLLEAYAMGIPIISSDVGWVPEFNVEHMYEAGNVDQLINILRGVEKERLERRKRVEDITWENYVKQLIKIFEGLIK